MVECTFCRIAEGDATAHRLYRDGTTIAFLDARPAVHGHALVAPVDHVESLVAADEPVATAVFRTARSVALAMDRTLASDGFSLFHTSGDLVGTVTHAHVHVLPRTVDDPIRVSLVRDTLSEEAGAALADRIRSAL